MIQNTLPVILAGYLLNFSIEKLQAFFKNVQPHSEMVPGRMNLFEFPEFKVLLDYAHNIGALKELQKFLLNQQYKKCIGIFAAPGDRRDEDIIRLGSFSAKLFDEIIIRHDTDSRTRTNPQITELLLKGILSTREVKVTVISDEFEALRYAISQAEPETFIFYNVEAVYKAISYMKNLQNSSTSTLKGSI